eukprot:2246630-Rhodomonas_salina.1
MASGVAPLIDNEHDSRCPCSLHSWSRYGLSQGHGRGHGWYRRHAVPRAKGRAMHVIAAGERT